MSIRNRTFFLFLFFIANCLSSFAQQYNFRQYNVQDGLAYSQVSNILQDTKGYVWITTLGGGVSRFDGKNFVTFSEKDGLSSNLIRCATLDKKGNLWLGTAGGGVSVFDGKTFSQISDSSLKKDDVIHSLIEDDIGNVWIATNRGVFKYDGKKITHLNQELKLPEISAKAIFQDSKKRIWFSEWDSGVYCIDGNNVKNYSQKDGLLSPCVTITEDQSGVLWFGLKNGAVKGVTKNGETVFLRHDDAYLNEQMIYSILADKRGNIWFGTQEAGLVKHNPKINSSEKITMKNGLPNNSILGLMEDFEGNIWMSCWGYGVVKYSGSVFVHFTAKDGLLSNFSGSIVQLENNDLLISSGFEISRMKEDGSIFPFEAKINSKIYALHYSKKRILWIATEDGLIAYSNGKQKRFTQKDDFGAFPATTIVEDSKGNIWCSSLFGKLSCYDGTKFINYSEKDGLKPDYIYSIYTDSKDNVWISTWAAGLCKFDARLPDGQGNKFTYFTKNDGLASNNVMTMLEDEKGWLWIGTYGGGMSVYKDSKFNTISTKNGLNDDAVVALVFDKSNDLWIATTKGLNRLNSKEYYATGKIKLRQYGKSEGLSEIECNRDCAFKSADGNIWFGTKTGLTKYTSADDHMNTMEPFTHITDVKLFFENADWSSLCDSINSQTNLPYQLSLHHSNNHLTFNFVGISTTIPEKVLYKYMLEGVDKGWSPPSDKTSVTYSGLPHGSYVFKVMACNNEGMYNQKATTFEFVILAPFWKTTWFYVICIVMVIGGFYIYVKLQTKKLARENKVLEEKVEERTAEVVKKKNELEFAYHEIEEKNRDIMDSINYAKRIQYTILANQELLDDNIPDHFILFQPKDIVSGDFYWATRKGNRFYLAVCDSTGHGVPGAFMSLLNISFLNEAISEKNIAEPNEVLNYVRERLISSVSKDGAQDGMDGILLCLDKDKNELTYAAALNAPVLVSNNELIQLSADKMPIGKGERMNSFTLFKIEMKPSDILFLYTDGYADQFGGASGKKFKYKQLHQLLLSNSMLPLHEQNEVYTKTINDWKGNLEQVDDILVIGVRI